MSQRDSVIHLVAGGVAGTVGAIVTCPLEVVKTRQQSSYSGFHQPPITKKCQSNIQPSRRLWTSARLTRPQVVALSGYCCATPSSHRNHKTPVKTLNIYQCLKYIIQNEGAAAMFKGLGPNLVGVAPSRAVYFATYSQSKRFWNEILPPDSPVVHVCSASCAGFMACTLTNPIWFVKTRLQLDVNRNGNMTAWQCVQRIYAKSGLLGFYKGITASYMGISETIVHFVIYEAIKAELMSRHASEPSSRDFLEFMAAGATSKTIASCIAYPHEVARTRLREEGNRYKGLWQTLALVWNEEGARGLYRGLTTQLVRQIPNTAIMMATYEAVVYLLNNRFGTQFYDKEAN